MSQSSTDHRERLKAALLAINKLQARISDLERSAAEPIAIIGVGCRFPGASGPEEFWTLLHEGRDTISDLPEWRFDLREFYDPNPEVPGKMYVRRGGFVENIEGFDAEFFGLSPREVLKMDPQHRLVLEVCWEALEHAALPPSGLVGARGGVFIGITQTDYAQIVKAAGWDQMDAYQMTGTYTNFAAGRIAYLLGLVGPAFSVDAACASSLVTTHIACRSLQARDCDVALAGGVNALLLPDSFVTASKARFVSPEGRCKTFDAKADGFVRGEGCGIVVLKRLSDAERDGDRIVAIIRGSAVNQDGKTSGLTVPNRLSQEAVIRAAQAAARVTPEQVQYIEAHGTGTSLGDPIELRGLAGVFAPGRPAAQPLFVGAVKTNFGHLESAAGIAGLIKVALSIENAEIPPHLNFSTPTPNFDWSSAPLVVPTRPTPWPGSGRKRLAGVSSFGASGTNAHVVIEQAPDLAPRSTGPEPTAHLLTVTARSAPALRALAVRYVERLAGSPDVHVGDLCLSANAGRTHFEHRLAVVSKSTSDLRSALERFVADGPSDVVRTAVLATRDKPRVAFLFTGQGSQYAGMARALYGSAPVFKDAFDSCDVLLRPILGRSLVDTVYGAAEATRELDQTAYTQPSLFALEYSLAALWRSWGVEPAFVLGHSVGEYAAACIAGVFGLEDALKLVAERGRIMQSDHGRGGMAYVRADEARVLAAIEPYAGAVAIAAINAPRSLVISGRTEELKHVVAELTREGIQCGDLKVSHAFHSPLMQHAVPDLERAARDITFARPRVRLASTLTGEFAAEELARPEHWSRQLCEPVRFAAAMRALERAGCTHFLEIGGTSTLCDLGRQCVAPESIFASSLRPGADDWLEMLNAVRTLYLAGVSVDWNRLERPYGARKIALPSYPFERATYWISAKPAAKRAPAAGHTLVADSSLLGVPLRSPAFGDAAEAFISHLSAVRPNYLADHSIDGSIVLPAAGYVDMALTAANRMFGDVPYVVAALALDQRLDLDSEREIAVQTVVRNGTNGEVNLEVYTEGAVGEWLRHATATLERGESTVSETIDLQSLRARCDQPVDHARLYERLDAQGSKLGPSFRNVTSLFCGIDESFAEVRLQDGYVAPACSIHPLMLDSCFQGAAAALPMDRAAGAWLPIAIERVLLHCAVPAVVFSHARLRVAERDARTRRIDITLYDTTGRRCADVEGFQIARVKRTGEPMRVDAAAEWLLDVQWREAAAPDLSAGAQPGGTWLIFADANGLGVAVGNRIRDAGGKALVVKPGASFARLGVADWVIDASNPGDFRRVLAEVRATGPVAGVVALPSLDVTSVREWDERSIDAAEQGTARTALMIAQALVAERLDGPAQLWLVTRGAQAVDPYVGAEPAAAMLWGLGRVISREHPELQCRLVDLDPLPGAPLVEPLLVVLSDTVSSERELAIRAGKCFAPRLRQLAPAATDGLANRPIWLEAGESGQLEDLRWMDAPRTDPRSGEVEIEVRAVGLNFRDVLCALRMYPGTVGPLGGECAGVVTRVGADVGDVAAGDQVMALAPRAFGTFVTVRRDLVAPRPPNLSFAEAATLPIAFMTAAYGLLRLARITAGERVLVHAGAGGVGLAAVQVALRAGAIVYATAGSEAKRAYLLATGVAHVFDSRSLGFERQILDLTGGRGVDVVLNSLSGQFIAASVATLANGGRFLELGKRGILTPEQFAELRRDATYHVFDLGDEALADPTLAPQLYADVLEGLAAGALRLPPLTVFATAATVDAFRLMAQAKHIGKIAVTLPRSGEVSGEMDGAGTYLVTGAFGWLGLATTRWLAARGARNLLLIGRRPPDEPIRAALDELAISGCRVEIAIADVADFAEVSTAIERAAARLPPLRGVVHAAGVLDDAVLENQTWARFAAVLAPKSRGAWNLHRLTVSADLDFFVCFSAGAAILGAPGQANYAAANSFLDGLAEHRKARGLVALAVNWGAWAGGGMAAGAGARAAVRWAESGISAIEPDAGFAKLAELLARADRARVIAIPADWSRFAVPELRSLLSELGASISQPASSPGDHDINAALAAAPAARRPAVLRERVEGLAAKVLGLPAGRRLDRLRPLHEMGLDSLMAVEMRNALSSALGHPLPAGVLFDYPSVQSLTDYLAASVLNLDTSERTALRRETVVVAQERLGDLEQLSESEAEALLLAELERGKSSVDR